MSDFGPHESCPVNALLQSAPLVRSPHWSTPAKLSFFLGLSAPANLVLFCWLSLCSIKGDPPPFAMAILTPLFAVACTVFGAVGWRRNSALAPIVFGLFFAYSGLLAFAIYILVRLAHG
jgi:hypothetical protein